MTRNKLIGLGVLALVVILGFKSCSSDKRVVVQQPAPVQSVQQQAPQVTYAPPPVQEVQPQYDQQQPNVVVVQQPPQTVYQSAPSSGGITAGHVAAGALGYFAGKSSGNRVQTRTIIRERTIVRPSRSYYGSRSFSRPSRSFGSRSFSRRRR